MDASARLQLERTSEFLLFHHDSPSPDLSGHVDSFLDTFGRFPKTQSIERQLRCGRTTTGHIIWSPGLSLSTKIRPRIAQ